MDIHLVVKYAIHHSKAVYILDIYVYCGYVLTYIDIIISIINFIV